MSGRDFDFWINDSRVKRIREGTNNVFEGDSDPETNPSGFVALCERLDALGRLR